MTSNPKGFDFRAACRKLNPQLAQKLYPIARREGDLRNRLASIDEQVEDLSWGRALHHADRLAALLDERRRIHTAFEQAEAERQADRQVTTKQRGKP